MLVFSLLMGALALCAGSLGLAVAVDPANFARVCTEPRALRRRRILGGVAFVLMACLAGWLAFLGLSILPTSLPKTGWFLFLQGWMSLVGGCALTLLAILAILVWVQIASRARERRKTIRR